jgi:uncharacterized repeat protein (TIGR04076 family)
MNPKNTANAMIGEYLGYSESETEQFMGNPRNREVLSMIGDLTKTGFIFRVIEAKGCGCRHRTGQEITVRGDGVIIGGEEGAGPCVYLVQAMVPLVYGAQEFFYAGMDPNALKFRQAGCFDVGLACKGIGHVVVELRAEPL